MKAFDALKIERFERIPSTQLYLIDRIRQSADPPDLVIAREQTDGQGRRGKSFYSPGGSGLYFSFAVLRKDLPEKGVTPRIALAARKAVLSLWQKECKIKWVNDLYNRSGKVCGVLTNAVSDFVVIGVGINLTKPAFIPEMLEGKLSWLLDQMPDNAFLFPETVYRALAEEFFDTAESVLNRYRKACFHIGREVVVYFDNKQIKGVCRGIDDQFRLLLDTGNKTTVFDSGYVSLDV